MDELSLWMEPVSETTVNLKGEKSVPILSSGKEKMRLTVILTARASGKKVKPFVIIPRKRPIKELEAMTDLHFGYSSKSWMNDGMTEKYLKSVIGSFAFARRCIIWDSFYCHKSSATKKVLKQMRMDAIIVPSGCTGLIQAPDVSWNKSFKANVRKEYENFISVNGDNIPKPSFSTVAGWISQSWDSIPEEQIARSMKQCGITLEPDGSEDEVLHCFHVLGNEEGLQILQKKRSEYTSCDLDATCDLDASSTYLSDDSISYCDSDESN